MMKYLNSRKANFNNGKINIRQYDEKSSTITASCKSYDISDNFIVHSTFGRTSTNGNGGSGALSRNDGKTYCLDTSNSMAIEIKKRIRKLTPTECERLQTIKDGYTNYVSDSQRYKMLGNGWTVDVISHIFSYI